MSLRLNSSDSLLVLETFNKEDIFIYSPFRPKNLLYPVNRHKKVYVYLHKFSVSFFYLKPVYCIILRGCTYFCIHDGHPIGGSLQLGYSLSCILPSSTSLDLIPSYMGLFHLLQLLLHRPSLSTCISRFHHCEQPFFPSI